MDEKASGNLGKVEAVGRKITANVTIAKYENVKMKDNIIITHRKTIAFLWVKNLVLAF